MFLFIVFLLCISRVTFYSQSWMWVLRTRILHEGSADVCGAATPFPHFLLWTRLVLRRSLVTGSERAGWNAVGELELREDPGRKHQEGWKGLAYVWGGGLQTVSGARAVGTGQRVSTDLTSSEGSSCGHLWPRNVPHPLGKPHPPAGLRTCPAPGSSRKGTRRLAGLMLPLDIKHQAWN